MSSCTVRRLVAIGSFFAVAISIGCGPPGNAETAASPVQGAMRSQETVRGQSGDTYNRRGEDGTVVVKVVAPAPAVWEALLATLTARKVTPTVLDRPAGRMGDTALVLMRQWNGQSISYYMNCGTSMTGPRADNDRVRAVLLVQLSRLKADTIAIAVHLSATATSVSGSSATPGQCSSNGRGESDLLDDLVKRMGGAGKP